MPKIKKVAVEAAKKLHSKLKKEDLEKLLKLAFAINPEENSKEESKEGESAVTYDEKKFKAISELIVPKHAHA